METHKIVSRNEWVEARMQHLKQEKELTRLRDELSAQRRDLPWVRVDKDYVFEGSGGKIGLPELFGDKSQLISAALHVWTGLGRRLQKLLVLG